LTHSVQLVIKMSVFNKTNDALIVDTFKNVFQRRSSEVFKPVVPEFRTIQKYMLHCQYIVSHFVHDGWSSPESIGKAGSSRFELSRHVEIARTCSNLVADRFEANFHHALWSQTGPRLVADLLARASSLIAS